MYSTVIGPSGLCGRLYPIAYCAIGDEFGGFLLFPVIPEVYL